MNHWPFIIGAYGATFAAMLATIGASWRAMRRAEGEAERLGRPK
jgi:heme exporter protein CcmD